MGDKNRVLVGLPERLRSARAELHKTENLIEDLKSLYGQRLILNDSAVLDQIGERLGCPKIKGDNVRVVEKVVEVDRGRNCPACTGNGYGPFCQAHKWHEG